MFDYMFHNYVHEMLKDRILDFFIKKYGKDGVLKITKKELGLIEHKETDSFSQNNKCPDIYLKTPDEFVWMSNTKKHEKKAKAKYKNKAKTKAKTKVKPKTKAPAKRKPGRPKKIK